MGRTKRNDGAIMFLRLTNKEGKIILVNMNNVDVVIPSTTDSRYQTRIVFTGYEGSMTLVEESLIDIEHMIDEKEGGE